MNEQQISLLSP